MSLVHHGYALTPEQDHDLRRAANATGEGPSTFARKAVMHAVALVLAQYPGAVVGLPSTKGRPRKGETKAQARARREQQLQEAIEREESP